VNRYFEIETDGGILRIPHHDAPEVLARHATALMPAYFVTFLEELVERMDDGQRGAVAEQFGRLTEHRQAEIRAMFEDLAPGGGQ